MSEHTDRPDDGFDDETSVGEATGDKTPLAYVLYWWPPPIKNEKAEDVGRSMLAFSLIWFFTLLVLAIVVTGVLSILG